MFHSVTSTSGVKFLMLTIAADDSFINFRKNKNNNTIDIEENIGVLFAGKFHN